MQRSDSLNPALGAAVVGLALIDAGGAEAKARPMEDVRLAQSHEDVATGDAYQHGRSLLAAGDTAGAIAAFRAALLASPQSIDALNGLGVAYDRIGRYDLSRSWYDTALAIDPKAVLVLNNLGYSLYLQGNYAAAIPLLQQVVESDDVAASRTGQRVLTLIAARMRADAIEGRPVSYVEAAPARRATEVSATPAVDPSVPSARAVARAAPATQASPVTQVEAPAARIEITSSGEQRLVLGGPMPAPELSASLGDAAPMVMVASAWTPREEARVAARAASEERAVAERARLAGQLAQALADVRLGPAAEARVPISSDVPAPPQAPQAPQTPTAPQAATLMASVRSQPEARHEAALVEEAEPAHLAARLENASAVADAAMPAWLLASRRPARPPEAAAAHDEPVGETSLAFESDDGELNAFAARMRGVAPPAEIMTISREEAVARLEGLLRRLRTA